MTSKRWRRERRKPWWAGEISLRVLMFQNGDIGIAMRGEMNSMRSRSDMTVLGSSVWVGIDTKHTLPRWMMVQ